MTLYKIFSEQAPGQTRVGFFDEANIVQEVWLLRDDQQDLTGSVHRIRVQHVLVGQNRAFARLPDGTPVSVRLPQTPRPEVISGAVVVVTIIASPRHGKVWQAVLGARVVTPILVLLPGQTGVKLSRNLDQSTVTCLQEILPNLKLPNGFGMVLRRAAGQMTVTLLQEAIDCLVTDWQARAVVIDSATPGTLYDGGSIRQRALRAVPRASYNICRIGDPQSEKIDIAVTTATLPQVALPSGGKLWFERTHALWSIDIDGADADIGKQGFDGLLGEAADAIARHIRLRGMSGLIAIDVPRASSARKKFRSRLQHLCSNDPQNPEILGMTRGGVLELRRPYGRAAIDELMSDKVAQAALAGLRLASTRPAFKPIELAVNEAMASWLTGTGKAAVAALERPVKLKVCLDDDPFAVAYIVGNVTTSG